MVTATIVNQEVLNAVKNREVNAGDMLKRAENDLLIALMASVRYNQSKAAKAYGVSRGTMRKLLNERFEGVYVGKRGE